MTKFGGGCGCVLGLGEAVGGVGFSSAVLYPGEVVEGLAGVSEGFEVVGSGDGPVGRRVGVNPGGEVGSGGDESHGAGFGGCGDDLDQFWCDEISGHAVEFGDADAGEEVEVHEGDEVGVGGLEVLEPLYDLGNGEEGGDIVVDEVVLQVSGGVLLEELSIDAPIEEDAPVAGVVVVGAAGDAEVFQGGGEVRGGEVGEQGVGKGGCEPEGEVSCGADRAVSESAGGLIVEVEVDRVGEWLGLCGAFALDVEVDDFEEAGVFWESLEGVSCFFELEAGEGLGVVEDGDVGLVEEFLCGGEGFGALL